MTQPTGPAEPSMPYGSVCECGAPLDIDLTCMAPNTLAHEMLELNKALGVLGQAMLEEMSTTLRRVMRNRRWFGVAGLVGLVVQSALTWWLGHYWGQSIVGFAVVAAINIWLSLTFYVDGYRDGVELVARGTVDGRPGRDES